MGRLVKIGIAVILIALLSNAGGVDAAVKVPFVAAQAPAYPIYLYNQKQLNARFPLFPHRPFNRAGFDDVMLPFHFVDHTGKGHRAEAEAFAFLISEDMDFDPGSYCNFHAYFLFKVDRPAMTWILLHGYQRQLIARLITIWQGTCAIGGTLIQYRHGFGADVTVFGVNGRPEWTAHLLKPCSYWTLLGRVLDALMTHFGNPPSAALKAYLRRPQCRHWQSVVELGRAAFAGLHFGGAFQIYARVLKRDPGFAAVRYWYADQLNWVEPNAQRYDRELAETLRSGLVPDALELFKRLKSGSHGFRAAVIRQTVHLLGPQAPLTMVCKLSMPPTNWRQARALLQAATRVAARYPNNYYLLRTLATRYANCKYHDVNFDKAAAITLAALESPFLPGIGNKANIACSFAEMTSCLGEYRASLSVLKKWGAGVRRSLAIAGMDLIESGQFKVAAELCRHALRSHPGWKVKVLPIFSYALAMSGNLTELKKLLRNDSAALRAAGYYAPTRYCVDRLEGKSGAGVNLSFLAGGTRHNLLCWYVYFEQCIAQHRYTFRSSIDGLGAAMPMDRLLWIFYASCLKHRSKPTNAGFYLYVYGVHRDDPWAKSVLADYVAAQKRRGQMRTFRSLPDIEGFYRAYTTPDEASWNTSEELPWVVQSLRRHSGPFMQPYDLYVGIWWAAGADHDPGEIRPLLNEARNLYMAEGNADYAALARHLLYQRGRILPPNLSQLFSLQSAHLPTEKVHPAAGHMPKNPTPKPSRRSDSLPPAIELH
jgi:tetratricopeptide (TPR) repeat protein